MGSKRLLTAAHCPNTAIYKEPDTSRYEIKVPAANRERFSPTMDMQWMTATSGHAASGQFYADGGSTPRTVTGYRSYAEVNDTGFFGTSKCTFICHYGKTTGQSCGEVYDKTAAPDYGKTSTTNGCALGSTYVACDDAFVEVRNKVVAGETQLACAGGDSGGPWFAYGIAFGIHSGGASRGTAPGQCDKAFFTPIERSTNIGVTIYIP